MSCKPGDAQFDGRSSILAPAQVVAEAERGDHTDLQHGGFQRLWLVLPKFQGQ